MQPIYIDLHIHTSENANNLNTNYDIAELVGQIKKLNGDSPFMISLTDHNTINKSAYLKAQNLDLNLIIGVELHIQNRAEAKSYHCHIYFNAPIEDAVIDSLNEILDELYPNKLPDRNDPNTPDIQKIINSFDTFDFILLPHGSQKHGAFNYSINDGENLDNAINRSIYYNHFDGFTSRSTKGLEATHQYFERLGISEFINLVTCSDNYSPSIYPRSHSGNDDDFIPTWMFAQPTFDGLRLSLSESTRLVASHEKPIPRSDYIGHVELQNEHIDVNVNLTEGLNVVIGGSSSGKTLFVDSLYRNIHQDFEGSKYIERYGVENMIVENTSGMTPYYISQNFIAENISDNNEKSIDKIEILRNIFPADDEINRSITTGLNKLHEVISEMLQYVEKIEDCERTLNALPNPGQLIVTGIVKKNALNILMPTAEEESLVKYPSNQYKIDLEAIETIRTFLENNPLIEDANEEINSIKTKLTLAAKAYTMFDDVSMVVKEHKQVVDRILKDELGQQQSRITNKDSLLKTVGEYIKVLTGFKHCKQELIKIKYSFQTREIEARGHKLSVINNFIFNEKVLVDALKYCLKSNINTIADVTPWNLMSRYFKKNPNVESYNDMTQRVYTKLMELNTRSYKIITKDGKDFNSLSPGWKTAILLDLILGYEQDTAPIIIDQPEDNLAVKYINSTLTETIKAVKWSKQVIMVSHNATIPMMADAQTIVVCENDGNKITIRSASLESEVFGQKVLDYIADQTDGGRTSIKKRVKKYNFKKYN